MITREITGSCTKPRDPDGGSPLGYDINPVPLDVRPRILSMMIDDQDNSASFDLVLDVGNYFGLLTTEMKLITGEVVSAVSRWPEEAAKLGISNPEVTRKASVFEQDDLNWLGCTALRTLRTCPVVGVWVIVSKCCWPNWANTGHFEGFERIHRSGPNSVAILLCNG